MLPFSLRVAPPVAEASAVAAFGLEIGLSIVNVFAPVSIVTLPIRPGSQLNEAEREPTVVSAERVASALFWKRALSPVPGTVPDCQFAELLKSVGVLGPIHFTALLAGCTARTVSPIRERLGDLH
jgi:hypothetical protein